MSYTPLNFSFAGFVYPGETLITEMWKEGDKVLFGKSPFEGTYYTELIKVVAFQLRKLKKGVRRCSRMLE